MAARFSLAKIGGRRRGAAALAVATATLLGLAGTVRTAEVLHQEGEHLRPTGKGWGELDLTGETARNALRFRSGGGGSNGISYHGGPVMLGTPNIYYIWFGDWTLNTAPDILTYFAKNLSNSPWIDINKTYYSQKGTTKSPVSGLLNYVRSTDPTIPNYYGQGTSLSDAQVEAVVASVLGTLGDPAGGDPNGVYFVLTSADVNETSGFCRQYCAWHTSGTINGTDIKYGFVGNPDRCPSACSAQSTSPNGNAGADGMANLIAHELSEALTDPDLNAWYDVRGQENADKCAWKFGAESTALNGSKFNVTLGGKQYLLQQNWVNANGGYCALSPP